MIKCVACFRPVDPDMLSFEQKLIEDEHFCRPCWDDVMSESIDELNYLDHPKFLAVVS